jgi:hypothetical protein
MRLALQTGKTATKAIAEQGGQTERRIGRFLKSSVLGR